MTDFDYARLVAKRQRRTRLRNKIAEAVWLTLVWACIAAALGTVASISIRIENQRASQSAHP